MERYGLTQAEYDKAVERGRKETALRIKEDPEAKRRVEQAAGLAYCRSRYPEAYGIVEN